MRRPRRAVILALLAIAATTVFALTASSASLPGSKFEIDNNANLVVNGVAPAIDWVGQNEVRQTDLLTGRDDDSYAGGAKEDDACPGTTTGSIPNNKSDLLTFGAYVEAEASGPGYLNLFWHRVNDPSGTTLMDFELNQSSTACANGLNRVRTAGDLLLEYSIVQGGAQALITVREWSGSAWGPAQDLSSQGLATGTINQTAIPAAQSDGLSDTPVAARTFGEMQLDLDFIFDEGSCQSFGSAFVKSRSSDSFTSQLKDFIRPVPVDIQNCGKVVIRKVTDPTGNAQTFGYTKNFATDPASADTFTLSGASGSDVKEFTGALFGAGTVTEDSPLPAGWQFATLDCSASTGVTPTVVGQTASWTIDAATDIVDCTYTNRLSQGAILVTKTRKHAADGPGPHSHAGVNFTVNGQTKATGTDGTACFDGLQFAAGGTSYNVTETVPAGYSADGATTKAVVVNSNAKCSDSPYTGETVSFANTPLTNITVSVDSQIDGGTASKINCGNGVVDTGANGDGSVTINDLEPTAPAVTVTCTITVDP